MKFRFLGIELFLLTLFILSSLVTTVPDSGADIMKKYTEVLSLVFLIIFVVLDFLLPQKKQRR